MIIAYSEDSEKDTQATMAAMAAKSNERRRWRGGSPKNAPALISTVKHM